MPDVKVSPEFESYLPPLDKETEELLENSIKAEGVRDPLIVWKGKNVLVDGHNRYRLAKKHNKPFEITEREFKDANDVRRFMLETQLSRRNLPKNAASDARGRLMKLIRASSPRGEKSTAAAQVAKSQGVSTATVKRDARFSSGLEKLRKKSADEANKVSTGTSKINKSTIEKLGNATGEEEKKIIEQAMVEAKREHKKQVDPKPAPKATEKPKPEPKKEEESKEQKMMRAVNKLFAATDTAGRRAAINDMIRIRGDGKMLPELEDRNSDLKGDLGDFDD